MIRYHKGSLFSSSADALAHGCNTAGKMDAGIAKQFRDRFPEMYADYQRRCRLGLFQPGEGYLYKRPQKPHIINLATQRDDQAGILYVDMALEWLANSYAELEIKSVAMPRIASGLGQLDWSLVEKILASYFESSDLKVEVWAR